MRNINIAILGPAGVGKSTIINKLKEIWESELKEKFIKINFVVEEEKHLFLKSQYEDKKKWTFLTQIDFLTLRARNLFVNNINSKNQQINIFDRFFVDDYLYAKFNFEKNYINNEQMNSYQDLFNKIYLWSKENNIYLDLAIILNIDEEILLKRMKLRDRLDEKENSDWFKEINNIYKEDSIKSFFNKYFLDVFFISNKTDKEEETSRKIINKIEEILVKNEQRIIEGKILRDFKE